MKIALSALTVLILTLSAPASPVVSHGVPAANSVIPGGDFDVNADNVWSPKGDYKIPANSDGARKTFGGSVSTGFQVGGPRGSFWY